MPAATPARMRTPWVFTSSVRRVTRTVVPSVWLRVMSTRLIKTGLLPELEAYSCADEAFRGEDHSLVVWRDVSRSQTSPYGFRAEAI